MEALLIKPKNLEELNDIKNFIKQKGLDANLVNEKQQKILAASMMIAIADSHPKFSDEEVNDIINQMNDEEENIYGEILDDDFMFIERKKLADIADKNYPQSDISIEEIVASIKESRAEDYAKKISVTIQTING